MAEIKRNIYYTPAMQRAYLNAVNRDQGAGFVNAERRASKSMSESIRSETERLYGLDMAGERRKDIYKRHRDQLALKKDQLRSEREAGNISRWINLGTLGLGYMNSRKTRAEADLSRQHEKDMFSMALKFRAKNRPEEYDWYISQPEIRSQIDKYGIELPQTNRSPVAFGLPNLGYDY